jgi:hypothetical protein
MTDTQDHQQKYSAGERIILGIEFYDDNGIYDVRGLFVHSENPKRHITLSGYGEGEQSAEVYIQNVVTTNTLAGQYVCEYIQAWDGKGNYRVLHPDISFYVEQQSASADDQGPELKGWSFLPQGAVAFVEVSMIEWTKREKQLDTERQLELTAARDMAEDTGAQGDIQESTPSTPTAPGDMQEGAQEDVHQLIEGKIEERISGMTEDTGAGGDVGLHIGRRMDEIAHDVTEETGAEGDVHLHVQRRMNEMAKKMFEED